MNDLSVHLRYHTTASLGRISDEFKHDPSDTSPGWFVEAYSDEGYKRNRKLTRVTADQALDIAQAIDGCFSGATYIMHSVEAQNTAHDLERIRRKERASQQVAAAQRELLLIAREEGTA